VIDLLEKTVEKAKIAFFKKGAANEPSYIKKVSSEWESFGIVKGDKAKRINCENNSIYTILYFAPKGSEFPPHFHENKETGIVLEGKVVIETPNDKFYRVTSQSYEIIPEQWHKFKFLTDTTLMLLFYPPFLNDDWIGTLET
jgi:quercetin dioxygenase-like cupin family protein